MSDFYGLVPRPLSADFPGGFARCRSAFLSFPGEFAGTAALCAGQLSSAGLPCSLSGCAPGGFEVALRADSSVQSKEGYELVVSKDGAFVLASGGAGAFYAMQTLRQLVMTAERHDGLVRLPLCRISDEPRFQWRGVMLDTCRNFYPVHFIKKLIDSAAFHKLNRFHWHLSDDQGWRLYVPEFPLLTEIGGFRYNSRAMWQGKTGGFYSHADVREVVEYAAERHVTVVPEIETPGHASALLAAYPGLGCTGGPYRVEERYGIFDDVLCAGNDGIFPLFDAVFDTVCGLFPGDYVHIGGDECPRTNWRTCPRCKVRMAAEGLESADELQSWLTVRLASMLTERGRIPVGWDEVLDGTERLGLPGSMVVQSWRGVEGGIRAAGLGHKVVMSPQTQGCYLDYKNYDDDTEPGWIGCATVEQSYAFSPVPPGSGMDEGCVLGGQGNLWSEVIYAPRIAEYMLFPRLCALSEGLWLPAGGKDFENFCRRLDAHKERLEKLDIRFYRGKLR